MWKKEEYTCVSRLLPPVLFPEIYESEFIKVKKKDENMGGTII